MDEECQKNEYPKGYDSLIKKPKLTNPNHHQELYRRNNLTSQPIFKLIHGGMKMKGMTDHGLEILHLNKEPESEPTTMSLEDGIMDATYVE